MTPTAVPEMTAAPDTRDMRPYKRLAAAILCAQLGASFFSQSACELPLDNEARARWLGSEDAAFWAQVLGLPDSVVERLPELATNDVARKRLRRALRHYAMSDTFHEEG